MSDPSASDGFKTGIVKEVPSGDCMVIMGTNWASGPPPVKTICLGGLVVPRVGRRETPDEPFAFQAREFLRKKLIGRTVKFRVDFIVPGGTRELGVVMLGEENVAESVVAAGWAKLRERKGDEGSLLKELAAAAENAQLGLWTQVPGAAAASIRDVKEGVEDAQAVKERAGGAELPAVVEYVQAADRMRILLGPPYHVITFNLSGIKAPGTRRNDDGTETAEPHAREAKFLIERTMLNRDVVVTLEGCDKFNNFFGSMRLKKENLAETLLTQGMAKCVEWSMKFASNPLRLREAQQVAKEARLRIWKNWVPPGQGPNAIQDTEYPATVTEVRSGDTLSVTNASGRVDTIALSSIRAPKLGNARREVAYDNFSWEAREFLRAYVGKKCMVKLEYKRVLPRREDDDEDVPEKVVTSATVMVESKKHGAFDSNMAMELVRAGFASVIQHREDDDRSEFYDDLLTAESAATTAKKGLHRAEPPPPRRMNDLTNQDPARANARLPSLVRQGKIKAVVEYCYNGGRFKLFLPKEDTFLNFAVSCVSCPSTSGRDREAEPFGEEALTFAKSTLLQRDVHIEIESCNRGGTFIGSLVYQKKNDYAAALLATGYGYITGYRASDELCALEAKAKDAKIKVWESFVDEDAAEEDTADDKGFLEVEVSEIMSGGHFYVQRRGDKGLEWVTEQLATMNVADTAAPTALPPKGTLVCAMWSGDWYRGKVIGLLKVDETTMCRVLFIDYGNVDVMALEQLRPMDASLSRMSPLATECYLAAVKCPADEDDYAEESAIFFRELSWGKQLVAKVEYREGAALHVTLFDSAGSADATINSAMLREGLGRVNRKLGAKQHMVSDLLAKLAIEENIGKKEHLNMWQYGDAFEEDEAPEFGFKPRT